MANEILASLDDINTFLPADKLQLEDADDDQYQIEVNRMITAFLSTTFTSTTLTGWNSPTNTPAYIRSIAGRLIAALHYRSRVSEEDVSGSGYAQTLYDEAMFMLNSVRSGTVILAEVTEDPTTQNEITQADFWPNDTTTVGPVFTMGMELG